MGPLTHVDHFCFDEAEAYEFPSPNGVRPLTQMNAAFKLDIRRKCGFRPLVG